MKKILTLATFVAVSTLAFAQRTIDWSVDSIYAPTELVSDPTTGTPIPINFVAKNNGPDTVEVGDSIWWNFVIAQTSGTIILGTPAANQTSYWIKMADKQVLPGDTIHIVSPRSTNQIIVQTTNVLVAVRSHVSNGADLTFEATPTNNEKINVITWYHNSEKWPVSIENRNAEAGVKVFPNPAASTMRIESFIRSVDGENMLSIYRIDGTLVYSAAETQSGAYDVNTAEFVNGVYVAEIRSGEVITKTKFVVNH